MPARQDPKVRDLEAARSRLKHGLTSCHFIVNSYRAKLAGPSPTPEERSPSDR
jgi:hypothetical protein